MCIDRSLSRRPVTQTNLNQTEVEVDQTGDLTFHPLVQGYQQPIQTLYTNAITDDKFFHLTCHVDANLKQKIQRGEFVELEKLLVKDKFRSNNNLGQRMELVNKGGETFIMPVDRDNKISNVRKWEQAFRIYAAIYSQANPQRSCEIWQYVYVSLCLCMQNVVSAQPCVGKFGISLVLLNFLDCNFRLWLETP